MEIRYSPTFLRALKKMPPALIEEVKEKIQLFKDEDNYQTLKVHKLGGRLKGQYSFSVNYQIRIVFYYISKKNKRVLLTAIGDHAVYKN